MWATRNFSWLVLGACFGLAACATTTQSNEQDQTKIVIPTEPEITPEPTPEPVPIPELAPVVDADGVIRQRVEFADLPGWKNADQRAAFTAFLRSCDVFSKRPAALKTWGLPCAKANQINQNPAGLAKATIRQFFEAEFKPYALSIPQQKSGLLTAYYEPELLVRAKPNNEFSEPILPRPDDLVTVSLRRLDPSLPDKRLVGRVVAGELSPYYARSKIVETYFNASKPKPALAWGRPIDVFFLQVQGSGRIRYPDGTIKRAAFAGHNGQKYHSIGRELIARGALTKGTASKQSIERWMVQAGPAETTELINTNPRYVFFQASDLNDPAIGPKGTQGAPLTAKASIAVDPAFHAFGSPIWVSSRLPATPKDWKGQPTQFLAIAQDTGGAIKGALRGDLFYGSGDLAGKHAGIQKHPATWWTLYPNSLAAARENQS